MNAQINNEFIIRDLDTLKAITHPLRLQLLKLTKHPQTVKTLAEKVDISPTKLYYHINLLEKHQIICVVETNIVSGIIEKTYQAAAKRYRVDEDLLLNSEMSDENLEALLSAMLDTTKDEIKNSFQAGLIDWLKREKPHRGGIARSHFQLTEAEAVEFYDKLEALIMEYDTISEQHEADETVPSYGLTLAFYPVADSSNTDID